jgi:hypothetical protein
MCPHAAPTPGRLAPRRDHQRRGVDVTPPPERRYHPLRSTHVDARARYELAQLTRAAVASDLDSLQRDLDNLRRELHVLRRVTGLTSGKLDITDRLEHVKALHQAGESPARIAAVLRIPRRTAERDVRALDARPPGSPPPARERATAA